MRTIIALASLLLLPSFAVAQTPPEALGHQRLELSNTSADGLTPELTPNFDLSVCEGVLRLDGVLASDARAHQRACRLDRALSPARGMQTWSYVLYGIGLPVMGLGALGGGFGFALAAKSAENRSSFSGAGEFAGLVVGLVGAGVVVFGGLFFLLPALILDGTADSTAAAIVRSFEISLDPSTEQASLSFRGSF